MKTMIYFLILMHLAPAAAELDVHQQQGLSDTKALLKSSSERNAFIKTDKNAKAADDKVEALTGKGANKDEVYGISAEVMDKLTKSTNGDPAKMQEILGEAAKDPEAFYNKYFDDSAKARVRGVAGKIQSPGVQTPR
jgi:hypothetical protein